jgi:hypothetical protein
MDKRQSQFDFFDGTLFILAVFTDRKEFDLEYYG